MAQSTNENVTTSSLQETQKQQKKQAKRESKVRLEVVQAKGDRQKAEQKVANVRVHFELHRHAYVHLRKNLLDCKVIPKANELFSKNCLLCNQRGNHTLSGQLVSIIS